MSWGNFLYGKRSKKEKQKETIASNRRKGAAAESEAMWEDRLRGYEVERKPHGQDYIRRKRNLWTGRVTKTEHVEVKSGKAKLSKLQAKTKKRKSNYVVKRRNPLFW